jgi:cytochrome c-type biogenesis protein CcmH
MLFVICLVFLGQPVYAQEATPVTVTDNQVNAIAKQLYCPVCENIPLDVCPTKACAQWRDEIRDMLAEGKTEQEIKGYFVSLHGDKVLATPPARGINWLIYLVPPLAILAGVYVLYRALKDWRKPAAQASQPGEAERDPAAGSSAEYVQRLEEELRKR